VPAQSFVWDWWGLGTWAFRFSEDLLLIFLRILYLSLYDPNNNLV
jgi:hypothetical protein